MNARKKLSILLVLLIGIVLLLFVMVWFMNDTSEEDENNIQVNEKDYNYDFGIPIDLENDGGVEENIANGTDYPSFGIVNDFYDETDIEYYDDKMEMETYDGNMIISLSWMNEGNALLVEQPQFNNLKKFILRNSRNVSVVYNDVNIKEYKEYIGKLAERGFSEVINEKESKSKNSYYYSVKNADGTIVTVNFVDGNVYMEIFKI